MSVNKESRSSKRVSVLLKGNYRVCGSDFPFLVMTAVNISEHGICFATDDNLPPLSIIELNIILPDSLKLLLFGKTIWSSPLTNSSLYRTGLQILNLESEDFKKFKVFYEERLLQPPQIP